MILLLLLGLVLLAAAGMVAARTAFSAAEERQTSIAVARSYGDSSPARDARARPLSQILKTMVVNLALRVWPRTSHDEVRMRLAAAGLSRRLSVEAFVAIRFVAVAAGVFFALSVGGLRSRGVLLAIIFGAAGALLPKFLLGRRA